MRPVHIIGVPLDLGGGRRGVDMGPSAFRIAGLGERIAALGCPVVDKGDLAVPIPETRHVGDPRRKYIDDIATVCAALLRQAREHPLARARCRWCSAATTAWRPVRSPPPRRTSGPAASASA